MDIIDFCTERFGNGTLVSSSKQEWEFTCPRCLQKDRLHVSLSKGGIFICVTPGCNFKGKIDNLDSTIIIDNTYKDIVEKEIDKDLLASIYTKAINISLLRDYHRSWLENRGIQPNKMKVKSTDFLVDKIKKFFSEANLVEAGLLREDNYATSVVYPNRILIPFFDPFDKDKCIYLRSRSIGNLDYNKYLSPTGVPSKGYTWGWENIKQGSEYVIITEGEFKAQAAMQLGFNCVATIGINSSHDSISNLCAKKNIKIAYILFDTENTISSLNVPKQYIIDKAATSLTKSLKVNNIKVFRAYLPSLGYDKMDIDKFILLSNNPIRDFTLVLKNSKKC